MNETLHSAPAKVGDQTLDTEHDLQMQLLEVFHGEKVPSVQLIGELRDWLLTHIATEDVAFGEYLGKKEGQSA
jgi:hemerythrin